MAIVRMCQCSRRTVYYNEHLLHSHLKRAIMFEFMLALALSRLSLRIPHFTLSSQSVSIRSHAKRITFAIFRPDNCLAIECFWVTNSIERERKKNTQTNHSMLPIWCDVIHFAFFYFVSVLALALLSFVNGYCYSWRLLVPDVVIILK